MKLKYSDNRKVFNIHTYGIPCLSFDMLDSLGVPNLFTTRYISYDRESLKVLHQGRTPQDTVYACDRSAMRPPGCSSVLLLT